MSQQLGLQTKSPPSSRGLGHSPFKAKTRVRIPVGAHDQKDRSTDEVERFLSLFGLNQKENLQNQPTNFQISACWPISAKMVTACLS